MYYVCLCLTSCQQLRSYGDGATAYSLVRHTGGTEIEFATPCLQGKWFIHYTTVAHM